MEQKDLDNHDQFLRLYVDNEESLRGFIRSLVPSLEDAKEVMQGTAAVLWRKFEQLDSPDNFRRWAFGVARFLQDHGKLMVPIYPRAEIVLGVQGFAAIADATQVWGPPTSSTYL